MMKTVLITGAERNSGYGMARKFLSEGWSVVITSRNEEQVQKVAADLEEEFKIPCYGFGFSPLDAITDTDVLFEKIEKAGIELDSLVCVAADLGRQMIRTGKAKGATIVFTGSVNYINALPERSAYVASKGAISSMTKALALDFAKYGVRVNCIAAGAILTDRYDGLDQEEFERRRSAIPLHEFSSKETMGEHAYFLASSASFPMTGSVVVVDGGSTSIMPGAF